MARIKKKNSHVDQIRFWNFVCDLKSRLKQALGGPLVSEMFVFYPVGNLINEPDRSFHTGFPALVVDNRIRGHRDLRYDYGLHGNITQRLKGKHEATNLSGMRSISWSKPMCNAT